MKTLQKSFLLAKSVSLLEEDSEKSYYDNKRDINISSYNGRNIPSITLNNNLTTQSKTFAAPGDDDPDREAENCY
jgi:hypothetical protein